MHIQLYLISLHLKAGSCVACCSCHLSSYRRPRVQTTHWPQAVARHEVLQGDGEEVEKISRSFSHLSFLLLLLCKASLSKPSFNPSEIELGCEVTLKDFPYVNYSRPRSRAEVGAHHLQMGSAPGERCKSPSSGRCRFGLIKSYTEPVYLSLLRILETSTFLPSLSF